MNFNEISKSGKNPFLPQAKFSRIERVKGNNQLRDNNDI
jgi:hypothetical protein